MRTQFIQEQIKTPSHAAAQLAQTELDALVPTIARKDAALKLAVEALDGLLETLAFLERNHRVLLPMIPTQVMLSGESALAACREEMGEVE